MPRASRGKASKPATPAVNIPISGLSVHKAALLVDKNSRTMMKLTQLLAIYNKPGASDLDDKGLVAHRIARYKRRISRRLLKLAKFVDTPENLRPIEPPNPMDPVLPEKIGSRKATMETARQKRDQQQKAKATKAMVEQKLKAQRALMLERNAQLKAKGALARKSSLIDPKLGFTGDGRPPPLPTELPALLPHSKFSSYLQVIFSRERNQCKFEPSPPATSTQSIGLTFVGTDSAVQCIKSENDEQVKSDILIKCENGVENIGNQNNHDISAPIPTCDLEKSRTSMSTEESITAEPKQRVN